MADHHDELKQAYDFFDKDGGGISKEELADAMQQFGRQCTEDELNNMMEMADQDGNGMIDYDEFIDIMTHKLEEQEMETELHTAF